MRIAILYTGIACGGALGAVARFAIHQAAISWFGPHFPWGTLLVNVAGCFLLGGIMQGSLSFPEWVTPWAKTAIGAGFLGALTTFSTFGVETWALIERGEWRRAGWYVTGSLVLGLIAIFVAGQLVRWLAPPHTSTGL
ncbi:MAG: fluoride efflux transporter CrcB [Pirellulaceae bacterium]|nr:fluoride efflux transporter CrcB [Planctomycetales bacterium]